MTILLGVFFDSKLTFQSRIDSICETLSQKLNVISIITADMNFNSKRLGVNAFLKRIIIK